MDVFNAARSNEIAFPDRNHPYFADKLSFGQKVSSARFDDHFFQRAMVSLYGSGEFNTPGPAFMAFRFDDGGGTQYGWARVRMGAAPKHKFILKDFAFADPGESITAGQTSSSNSDAVPASGSLGMLALGAAGLAAQPRDGFLLII